MSQKTTGWGITNDQIRKDAAMIKEFENLNGAYRVKIVEAVWGFENSGAEFVKLALEINEHTYPMNKIYLFAGDEKGKKPLYGYNLFMGAFGVLNELKGDPIIEDLPAKEYNFEKKEFETVTLPQFRQLINRIVGVIVVTSPKFRRVLIDGYSKIPVMPVEGVEPEPEQIWYPNYDDQVAFEHQVIRFFDYASKLTFAEIQQKNEGKKIVPKDVDKVVQQKMSENFQRPSIMDMDKEAERLLRYRLDKFKLDFNPKLFVSFAKYGGSIPLDSVPAVFQNSGDGGNANSDANGNVNNGSNKSAGNIRMRITRLRRLIQFIKKLFGFYLVI